MIMAEKKSSNDFSFRHFLYVSNILSISRVLLTLIVVYLMKVNSELGNIILIILAVIAILTDYFDGFFSRKLNQVTSLGILLDPLADKISLIIIFIALILFRDFPLPIFILLIYRDILILALGWIILKKSKIPESNWWGKINTGVVSVLAFFSIIKLKGFLFDVSYYCSYMTIFISGISYYVFGERQLLKSKKYRIIARITVVIITLIVFYFAFKISL